MSFRGLMQTGAAAELKGVKINRKVTLKCNDAPSSARKKGFHFVLQISEGYKAVI